MVWRAGTDLSREKAAERELRVDLQSSFHYMDIFLTTSLQRVDQ